MEKLPQEGAAGIFHPHSGFSGCHFAARVAPLSLCLVPAMFEVMQSPHFSLLIIQRNLKFMLVMPQLFKKGPGQVTPAVESTKYNLKKRGRV